MANIRKRQWRSRKGKLQTRWLVDFRDPLGRRRAKQFNTRAEAKAWLEQNDLRAVSTDTARMTLAEAGKQWLDRGEDEALERSSMESYRFHVEQVIGPYLGHLRLADLSRTQVRAFRKAVKNDRSEASAERAILMLKMVLNFAVGEEWVGKNVARKMKAGPSPRQAAMIRRKNMTIPTVAEARKMLEFCDRHTGSGPPRMAQRTRLLLATLMLTGIRPSEARGLHWSSVKLDKGAIVIDQRVDRWNVVGPCKSVAAYREVPIGPILVEHFKQWQKLCPASELDLVFPTRHGTPLGYRNLAREFGQIQLAAGLTKIVIGRDGKRRRVPKFKLYDLRHFRASWWIFEGLDLKRLTTYLGHASIQLSFDTYAHLIKDAEAQAVITTSLEEVLFAKRVYRKATIVRQGGSDAHQTPEKT